MLCAIPHYTPMHYTTLHHGTHHTVLHWILIFKYKLQLNESPFLYDGYVELIGLLSKQGELEDLRETREKMNKVFPLTEGE